MATQQRPGAVEDLDIVVVEAHRNDVAGRGRDRRVIRAQHLHEPAVIDCVRGFAKISEPLGRQWAKRRLLLGEHRKHLAFLAAVDARRRPALLPVREPGVLLLDGFELAPFERGGLSMLDRILNRTFRNSSQLHVIRTMEHMLSG